MDLRSQERVTNASGGVEVTAVSEHCVTVRRQQINEDVRGLLDRARQKQTRPSATLGEGSRV